MFALDFLTRLLKSVPLVGLSGTESFFALRPGSPGSDAFIIGTPENNLLLTRQGNDVLLAVDPGAANPGQGEIDILGGDTVIPLLENSSSDWNDRFILGDGKKPYYVSSQGFNFFGLKDFALILDFNPEHDIIQLHGIPEDYRLAKSPFGTAIFWHQETGPDLVAFLFGASGLSLEGDYFQFKADTSLGGPVLGQIKQLGSASIDFSLGVATDDSDNVYLTGVSSDVLEGPNAGVEGLWVTKYDSDGNQQWLKQAGTTGRIATDNSGNVYLGGGLGDVSIAKYDSEGNQLWTQQFGTVTLEISFDLDVDDYGNLYVTGYTLGDLGGPNESELTLGPIPVPSTDVWIAKYDSNGNQLWLKQFGSPNFDEAFGVAIDSDGHAYTTGWTVGDFGGFNAGAYDVWVAKTDSEGNQLWLKQFGTEDYDWSWDAVTDRDSNVYITGWTLGDLGGLNAGSYDAWVAKYDSEGNQLWLKQFGTAGDDAATRIDVDGFGNFYLTGYTDADFGGSNAGSYDAWVAKYDSEGNQLWTQQFGTSELEQSLDVAVNSAGQVFATGFTEGSLGATNAGSYDAWIAKLSSADGALLSFSPPSGTAASLALDQSGLPLAIS